MPQEFARRVQHTLATEMGIQGSEVTREDVAKWLAGNVGSCMLHSASLRSVICMAKIIAMPFLSLSPDPPQPPAPPPPQPILPKGPIIPESEFTPISSVSPPSLPPGSSPEMETMVRQVIAVLPQVPHTTIRNDLCECGGGGVSDSYAVRHCQISMPCIRVSR